MEIVCDLADKGYWVLYGTQKISNEESLIKFIEGLLKSGKKVLVAVDNAHDAKTASIFYVIDRLSSYELCKNIRFILTARIPDFDRFIKDSSEEIAEDCQESISKLTDPAIFPNFRYPIPSFSKDDVKSFIQKYGDPRVVKNFLSPNTEIETSEPTEKELEEISDLIHKWTNGSAIMIKFYVLKQSLNKDVKDKYRWYLKGYPERIKTMLICSILEYGDFFVTDELLANMELLKSAYELEQATLHKQDAVWITIHRAWSYEFLTYMFDHNYEDVFLENRQYLKNALSSIIDACDEKASVAIIKGIYRFSSFPKSLYFEDFEFIFGKFFNNMPDYLSEQAKIKIYQESGAAHAYSVKDRENKSRLDKALERYDQALKIDPKSDRLLHDKAIVYYMLKDDKTALDCLNEATSLNIKNVDAWDLKADVFKRMGLVEEALNCYYKTFELCPKKIHIGWPNAAHLLAKLGRLDEAIDCLEKEAQLFVEKGEYEIALRKYEEMTKIKPTDNRGMHLKADLLTESGRFDEALVCYNIILESSPDDIETWVCKGNALIQKKEFNDAKECFDKAIQLSPNQDYPYAWFQKGLSLDCLGNSEEANKHFEKALELINAGLQAKIGLKIDMLYQLRRYDQTIESCCELLKLDPKNVWSWFIKGQSQFCLSMFDEAIKSFDEAVKTFDEASKTSTNYIETIYNRARAKASKGDKEGALADLQEVMAYNKEECVKQVEQDDAFKGLKDDSCFRNLINSQKTTAFIDSSQ